MNVDQIKQLLAQPENPKLEFKAKWYSNAENLDDKGWGEFLKDIISLANGNIGYVGNCGYLIIGVDDEDPLPGNTRKTFHVQPIGELSQLQKLRDATLRKIQVACSPPLPDIRFEFVTMEEKKNLLLIEIPSPAGLLKLDRDLNTRGIRFRKGTVLNRIGQDVNVADPTEIVALEQEFKAKVNVSLSNHQKVLHNLPQPDYIRFVGRKAELDKLRSLLHPQDRIWTVVIDGIGGIGKSALALEIAHCYLNEFASLQEENYKAIIWVSAKTTTLTADGIKPRQQISRTLSDMFKIIAITLGEDELPKTTFEDQNRFINRALSRQRTLLIIDNLETIDDEQVNAFIRELPSPTKCIVTTRYRIDIADPIRLTGMIRDDGLLLINQECNKKNVHLLDTQIDLLYRRTGGIPLAIVWSIAQMSYGYNVESVLYTLGNAKGDIAQYCFENAINQIRKKSSYNLLLCISLCTNYSTSITRGQLGKISGLSDLDCDESLVELEKLSLINRQNNSFSILPLVKQYVIDSIIEVPSNILENLIHEIIRFYPPDGVEALLLTEIHISPEIVIRLKEEVTQIIINQMYDWLSNYGDDYGALICVGLLERLSTVLAINELKAIIGGSLMCGWGSANLEYAEKDALSALGRAGEFDYILDWVAKGMPYASYLKYDDVIHVIKQFGNSKIIPQIDELLSKLNDDDIIKRLNEIKIELLSKP